MSPMSEYRKEYDKKNRKHITSKHSEYVSRNRERVRAKRIARDLRFMYGITIEEYNKMFSDQSGCCAICERPESIVDKRTNAIRRLSVDHDHETGIVRGLLCHGCNVCLGFVEDSFDLVESVKSYIKKHKKLGY